MNIKVIISVITLLCVCAFFYGSIDAEPHVKQESRVDDHSKSESNVISKKDISQLTPPVEAERYPQSVEKQNQTKQEIGPIPASNGDGTLAEEEAFLFAIADKIISDEAKPGEVLDNIQSKFDAEEIDANWAHTFEENIYSTIIEQGDADVSISRVECKTSLCKVELDALAQDKTLLGMKFTKMLSEQSWSQGSGYYFNYHSAGENLEVIITRDENTLNEFFN